jgi:hypothetical protein
MDEQGAAKQAEEVKPLPDVVRLGAAQRVSLTALRNDDAFRLQEIAKLQAGIKAHQEQMSENQNTRLEILKDIEAAESLPLETLKDYQFAGKELIRSKG